jgi:hypothetical protein
LPKVKKTDVLALGKKSVSIEELDKNIIGCNACPRLVAWRNEVAITKRKSYMNHDYWGKPVTGFGSEKPRLVIVVHTAQIARVVSSREIHQGIGSLLLCTASASRRFQRASQPMTDRNLSTRGSLLR